MMHETLQTERAARERPRGRGDKAGKWNPQAPAEAVVEVGGRWYRLDIQRREFRNVDDPTDRVSFRCGDPLIEDGDKWRFSGEENKRLTIAALRLHADPSLTLQEAFHGCSQDGHRFVPDWARDLAFNRHYVLHPKRCKICGLKVYETEAVTRPACPSEALVGESDRRVTPMADASLKIHADGDAV